MKVVTIYCSLLLICLGQTSLPREERLTGKEVESAFVSAQQSLQKSSAVFYDSSHLIVIQGVVVSSEGDILTKLSELNKSEKYTIRVDKKAYKEYEIVAKSKVWDLALIRLKNVKGLQVVEWARNSNLPLGSWVITNGSSTRLERRISIGVRSANTREIERSSSKIIGAKFDFKKEKKGFEILKIDPKSKAKNLKVGDIVTHFEGMELNELNDLKLYLFKLGEKKSLQLKVLREGKQMELEVELIPLHEINPNTPMANDHLNGDFSKRRTKFPRVLQVDIPLNRKQVGGPLLNLRGNCIGMTIARFSRSETYAIPMEYLKEQYQNLLKSLQ